MKRTRSTFTIPRTRSLPSTPIKQSPARATTASLGNAGDCCVFCDSDVMAMNNYRELDPNGVDAEVFEFLAIAPSSYWPNKACLLCLNRIQRMYDAKRRITKNFKKRALLYDDLNPVVMLEPIDPQTVAPPSRQKSIITDGDDRDRQKMALNDGKCDENADKNTVRKLNFESASDRKQKISDSINGLVSGVDLTLKHVFDTDMNPIVRLIPLENTDSFRARHHGNVVIPPLDSSMNPIVRLVPLEQSAKRVAMAIKDVLPIVARSAVKMEIPEQQQQQSESEMHRQDNGQFVSIGVQTDGPIKIENKTPEKQVKERLPEPPIDVATNTEQLCLDIPISSQFKLPQIDGSTSDDGVLFDVRHTIVSQEFEDDQQVALDDDDYESCALLQATEDEVLDRLGDRELTTDLDVFHEYVDNDAVLAVRALLSNSRAVTYGDGVADGIQDVKPALFYSSETAGKGSFIKHELDANSDDSEQQQQLYFCDTCDKTFANRWRCVEHMGVHYRNIARRGSATYRSSSKLYKCHMCDKSFQYRTWLARHVRRHLRNEPYACSVCLARFEHEDYLDAHRCRPVAEKRVIAAAATMAECALSDGGVVGDDVLAVAVGVWCNYCGKHFVTRDELKRHATEFHPDDASDKAAVAPPVVKLEKSLDCKVCEKRFSRQSDLTKHMGWYHPVEFEIPTAQVAKVIASPVSSLPSDEKVTTYCRCSLCGRSFSRQSDLTKHYALHHAEQFDLAPPDKRTYACHSCDKVWSRLCDLSRHISRKHSNNDNDDGNNENESERSYESSSSSVKPSLSCATCDKTFSRKCDFTRHMSRYHDDSKPRARSPQPAVARQQQSGLKSSEMSLFACKICDKNFVRQSDLTKHMRSNHADALLAAATDGDSSIVADSRENICKICNYRFMQRVTFRNHMQQFHSVKITSPAVTTTPTKMSGRVVETENCRNNQHRCSFCSRLFPTRYALLKHRMFCRRERRTDGTTVGHRQATAKNNKCAHCDMAYHRAYDLKLHVSRCHLVDAAKTETDETDDVDGINRRSSVKKETIATKKDIVDDDDDDDDNDEKEENRGRSVKKDDVDDDDEEEMMKSSSSSAGEHYCAICRKSFGRRWTLKKHMLNIHDQKLAKTKKFTTIRKSPSGTHRPQRFWCSYCRVKLDDTEQLVKHRSEHVKCRQCPAWFASRFKMANHVKHAHPRNRDNSYKPVTSGDDSKKVRKGQVTKNKTKVTNDDKVATMAAVTGKKDAKGNKCAAIVKETADKTNKKGSSKESLKLSDVSDSQVALASQDGTGIDTVDSAVFERTTDRPFKCALCPRTYKSKKALKNHGRASHANAPATTTTIAATTGETRNKVAKNSDEQKIKLPVGFYSKKRKIQVTVTDKKRPIVAAKNVTAVTTAAAAKKKRKTTKKFDCSKCSKSCAGYHDLMRHWRAKHQQNKRSNANNAAVTATTTARKNKAKKLKPSSVETKATMKNNKIHHCQICSFAFGRLDDLAAHLKQHAAVAPLQVVSPPPTPVKHQGAPSRSSRSPKNNEQRSTRSSSPSEKTKKRSASSSPDKSSPKRSRVVATTKRSDNNEEGKRGTDDKSSTTSWPHKCQICREGFPDMDTLARHLKTHVAINNQSPSNNNNNNTNDGAMKEGRRRLAVRS